MIEINRLSPLVKVYIVFLLSIKHCAVHFSEYHNNKILSHVLFKDKT